MELVANCKLLDLSGKTAIVTGAIGIGYGIAYRLAEAGANVMVASLIQDEVSATVAALVSMIGPCVGSRWMLLMKTTSSAW